MDYSTEYQQYYQQQYQQQQPPPAAAAEMQAYYAYDHQQKQYQYYPSQDYPTASYPQQFHQESTSTHPPGVPIPPDPTHFPNHHNAHFPLGIGIGIEQPSNLTLFSGTAAAAQRSVRPQFGQSACRGGGRKGGKPFRRGGRLVGRGRGHGAISNSTPSAAVPGQTSSSIPGQVPGAPTRPPPPMAWCELCRVDCNTLEILEQHKNGKRHKRNLRTHADLQNLNKCIAGQQNIQMPNSGSQPEVSQPEKVEECREKQPLESLPSQTLLGNASNETEMQKNTVDSVKEPQRKSRDQPDSRGCGSKRKMRGGRGGKYMRTNEGGPRRPIEPPKPKGVIPLICELCNVKCESQVVLAQLLTYVLSQAQAQAQAPGLLAEQLRGLAAQIPGLVGMVAPAPAPGSSQETQYQHDFRTQRSMATTEEGSKNTVMVEAEDQQQSIATDLESPETVGIETKEKNASLPQDKKIISSLENPINTASASKCEVASGGEAVQQQHGDDLVDSENEQDLELHNEEDAKEDTVEALQLQNNE
ncbi:zinc finger protein [Citrus sinensis]|uniref:Zinc finger protein n=1 Tax=Citrus sinensis TaxID=2711 RepID=A0ACB8MSB0_CITSI|nr:zinc finger protein [Citrus sinensis]